MRTPLSQSLKTANVCATLFCMMIALTLPVASPCQASAQTCSVKIISPSPGGNVRRDALVRGTAKIPANGYLWLLAHKRGFKQWWPQGGGEADINGGEWEVLVIFGKAKEIGAFEIAAVVVDSQTNEDLKRWVADAPSRDYPSIDFPNSLAGCSIEKITVDKIGD
ncbi:MAG: hypothetical protein WCF57_06510 [Pyrinomonadaceae bacterium]